MTNKQYNKSLYKMTKNELKEEYRKRFGYLNDSLNTYKRNDLICFLEKDIYADDSFSEK